MKKTENAPRHTQRTPTKAEAQQRIAKLQVWKAPPNVLLSNSPNCSQTIEDVLRQSNNHRRSYAIRQRTRMYRHRHTGKSYGPKPKSYNALSDSNSGQIRRMRANAMLTGNGRFLSPVGRHLFAPVASAKSGSSLHKHPHAATCFFILHAIQ